MIEISNYTKKRGQGGELLKSVIYFRWAALIILLVLLLPGCQAPQKPRPPQTTPKTDQIGRTQLSPSEKRILTSRLSNTAAGVKGVKQAVVVLEPDNNNRLVALIGLTLNGPGGTQTPTIKNTVTQRVKKTDRRITQVLTTADPNMVKRLSDIAAGIIEGRPIKSYARDVKELNRMLKD
jgi:YhcN/YlaJ family sporulation lipoprotein